MNTLFRLALTLTVAVVASLTPVAFAQDDLGPLDQASVGTWQSGDGGTARFTFLNEARDNSGRTFYVYEGYHFHKDGGGQCNLKAWYYPHNQSVYFQYKHGTEFGDGTWAYGTGRDQYGNYVILTGNFKSKTSSDAGKWTLWIRR
jgi:hypothetical protein